MDLLEDFLPPSRPAARFCDLLPPLPLPDFLPPLLEALGEFAIEAARCLLIPFLRRPSYCLSSLTLEPWSFAIAVLSSPSSLLSGCRYRRFWRPGLSTRPGAGTFGR